MNVYKYLATTVEVVDAVATKQINCNIDEANHTVDACSYPSLGDHPFIRPEDGAVRGHPFEVFRHLLFSELMLLQICEVFPPTKILIY